METRRVDVTDHASEGIELAIQALRQGDVVGLPTETVYGLAARADRPTSSNDALARLKVREADKPITLAVARLTQAEALVDLRGPHLLKLARRFWPGPLTLVAPRHEDGALLGIRIPAHAVALGVLESLQQPVHLTSANHAGSPPALDADAVLDAFAGKIPLVLDAGPSQLGEASAVIGRDGQRLVIHREGLIDREMAMRVAATRVLLVCTGNTCRSPMAEAVFRDVWAKRRGVRPDALLEHGGEVVSAGAAAVPGIRASTEAIHAARAEGLDLDGHRSQPLTAELLRSADWVFALGGSHLHAVAALAETLSEDERPRMALLDPDGGSVPDPIGGDLGVYRSSLATIRKAVERRVAEVDAAE